MLSFTVRRNLSWTFACCCVVGAGGLIIISMTQPLAVPDHSQPLLQPVPQTEIAEREQSKEPQLKVDDFRQLWGKRLHGPVLAEEPAPVERVEPKPPAAVKFTGRLVGTLMDPRPEYRIAWIRFGADPPLIVGEGMKLQGQPGTPEIVRIHPERIMVTIDGRQVEVILERPDPPFSATARDGYER